MNDVVSFTIGFDFESLPLEVLAEYIVGCCHQESPCEDKLG
jgi:hypothetical protein